MENKEFFDKIDKEEKAYWLGFLYADGHLHKSGKQIRILLSSVDENHLLKIAGIFGVSVKKRDLLDKRTNKIYTRVQIDLCSVHMYASLVEKGFDHQKTITATGEILKHIPDKLLHHFLRGFFDGDGHIGRVSHKGKTAQTEYRLVLAGTNVFLTAVQELMVKKLGLRTTKILYGTGVHRLQWGGVWQLTKIYRWLYRDATVFLERKKIIFDGMPNKRGTSKYQGVFWQKLQDKWIARIYADGKLQHIGCFDLELEAARAYDNAARKYYGEDACLNFPLPEDKYCSVCGNEGKRIIKGLCSSCYMKVWHKEAKYEAVCQGCGNTFTYHDDDDPKFCSRSCYWKSMEFDWPSWEWIDEQLQHISIRQLAVKMDVKYTALYMRIRRRKQRAN